MEVEGEDGARVIRVGRCGTLGMWCVDLVVCCGGSGKVKMGEDA